MNYNVSSMVFENEYKPTSLKKKFLVYSWSSEFEAFIQDYLILMRLKSKM